MSGLTPEGFEPKPLEEIKSDLESGFRAQFGAAISLVAQSVFGQLIGIMADRFADLWQLGLAIYNASFREGASDTALDNIGALTGTARKAATYTHVSLTLTGTNGTVIGTGQLVSIPGTGTQFTNDIESGTISGGVLVLDFRAVETGPLPAYADTVTQIDTPVAGWASVNNPLDHVTLGSDVEADAAYRLRQVEELRAQGASTVAAIRAKVSEIQNVIDVFVFENVSDTTDANGLPGHSFETVVDGGTDAEVAKAIADFKPVGIATYGTTTVATTDANGFAINIKFSRPANLNVYVTINQIANSAEYPSNGDDLVKAAIVALESNYRIGAELRSSALIPAYVRPQGATSGGVPGVLESALPLIGLAPSPGTSTTISVTNRQRVRFDTSRIVVNTTLTLPS